MILKNYYELTKLTIELFLFAKGGSKTNHLTTKNPKKIPTKFTKDFGLLGACLSELGGKIIL
jgi:hypothetical protein